MAYNEFSAATCEEAGEFLKKPLFSRTDCSFNYNLKPSAKPVVKKPTPPGNEWTITMEGISLTISLDILGATIARWKNAPPGSKCKQAWDEAERQMTLHEQGHLTILNKWKKEFDALNAKAQKIPSRLEVKGKSQDEAIQKFKDELQKIKNQIDDLKTTFIEKKEATKIENEDYDNAADHGRKPHGAGDKWSPAGAKPVFLDCTKCEKQYRKQ